jgi:photosystem II stability/assembly factor-like uncharacterized protein
MVSPSAPSTLDRPSGLRSLLLTALFVAASLASLPRPAAAGVGQWTTHGPEGGSVSAIVIDPVAPNFIYVLTSGFEGAFRSVDHGLSWQHMNVDPGGVELALAVDPQQPSTVYATTEHGVFKSVDRGLTWSSHGPPDELSSVAVDPVTPSTLYAGSFFGEVYKSTDGGASWQATSAAFGGSSGNQVNALAIDPANPKTLYAGTLGSGVFKSTDSGASWSALPGSPMEIALSSGGLVLDPRAPGTLFAVDLGTGAFKSTDSGAHWTRVYPYFDAIALALDPDSPATLYVATFSGVERSQDGGVTWTPSGVGNREVLALAVDPLQTSTLFAGTLGRGIFASADGARTWTATNSGLLGTVLSTLAIDPSDRSTVYAGSSAGDAFKTRDGGLTWDALDLPSNPQSLWALAIDPATPTTVYAARTDGVLKSVDGGQRWALADNGLPTIPLALAIDPVTPKTVYAGTANYGVYKSVDGGGSWKPANSGQSGVLVWALAIDPVTPSTLYAATAGHGVLKSTDAGRTWIAATSGLSDSAQGVVAIAIDPTAPSRLYACDAGLGLVRSTDAGEHWRLLSPEGLAFFGCTSLAVTATSPATVYAGSSGDGVLVSRDGGGSWSQVADGLGRPFVSTLAVDATGTDLHAGTVGAGIFDYTAALPAPCVASDTTACLHGGRFAVGASFSTGLGLAGAGHLVPLTDDTAYVWFFSPTNVEAVLKVVDGCALGDHFWVFDAGLTDVQSYLTVTDTVTGIVRSYFNPQGTAFQPNQDTRAFPCTGGATAAIAEAAARRSVSTLRP